MTDVADTITFSRAAFDELLVQIVHRNLLTPDMGKLLDKLVETEVPTPAYEEVGWIRNGEVGLGPAQSGETVLYVERHVL